MSSLTEVKVVNNQNQLLRNERQLMSEEKELRVIKVTFNDVEYLDPSFFIQIDDSLSSEDLKTKEFKSFVKKRLVEEWYGWNGIPKGVLRTVKLHELDLKEEETNFYLWYGVYKNINGEYDTCVAFENQNIQSAISCHYFEKDKFTLIKNFDQIYLSCSLDKTKELWEKGDIELLKSYQISDGKDSTYSLREIYNSRNFVKNISIRSKEHLQKR